MLFDPGRDLPVVIFSEDRSVGPEINDRRAASAARRLAGVCSVYLLGPSATRALAERLPEGFRVFGGAARLYLPRLDINDPEDLSRHRWYPPWMFGRHVDRAGQLVASRLATTFSWPSPPDEWDKLRSLVSRPTDKEIADRVSDLTSERALDRNDVDALRQENLELMELLVLADSERHSFQTETRAELARLREELARVRDAWLDDVADLESVAAERDALARSFREVGRSESQPDKDAVDDRRIDLLEVPLSPSAAMDLARTELQHVVIHPEALRDVDRLDGVEKDRVWASHTWQGLCALEAYAADVASGTDANGFFLWCKRTGRWPTNKVAMVESETVMDTPALARHRRLPVAAEVSQSGSIEMQAHLKIQIGGATNVPRLYFYDDTGGTTRKIHVGFYGPHDLMPNTRTN
jgi:hypothetical protein